MLSLDVDFVALLVGEYAAWSSLLCLSVLMRSSCVICRGFFLRRSTAFFGIRCHPVVQRTTDSQSSVDRYPRSVCIQAFPNYGILLIDSFSTDGTGRTKFNLSARSVHRSCWTCSVALNSSIFYASQSVPVCSVLYRDINRDVFEGKVDALLLQSCSSYHVHPFWYNKSQFIQFVCILKLKITTL